MPFPVTMYEFIGNRDAAKAYADQATNERDPEAQRNLALISQAYAAIAQAEAIWLKTGS